MWKLFASMIAVCCALGSGAAGAISFEARDFETLVREADQVVTGVVVAARSRKTGEREIVTDYRFEKIEVIKGAVAGDALDLTMLGGTVGSETLTVPGAPTFKRGTRYVIFVSGNGNVMFPLVGGHQGIFQLRKDAVSGVTRVRDYAGKPLLRLPRGKSRQDTVRDDAGESMTEAAFVDAIRAASNSPATEGTK